MSTKKIANLMFNIFGPVCCGSALAILIILFASKYVSLIVTLLTAGLCVYFGVKLKKRKRNKK